jgi:O-antigen ligase
MTLTTRTYIWTKALRSLEGHYIFGYGVQSNEVIRSVLSLTSTHNGWFDFIYRGGVILFTFMFIVLYRVGAIINRLYDLKEVKIVTAALVFFLIRFLAEPQPEAITLAFLFTLLILLYSIDISVDYCLL